MVRCDICLGSGGKAITANVGLCSECSNTARGRDIKALAPVYEIVEETSPITSLSQLALHNLLNLQVRHNPILDLDSAGIGEGLLEFGVSLYWVFNRGKSDRVDYSTVFRRLEKSFREIGDDTPRSVPGLMQSTQESKQYAGGMVQDRELLGGGIANPRQHRKVALKRYSEYSDTMQDMFGFDIRDAITCIDELRDIVLPRVQTVGSKRITQGHWEKVLDRVRDSAEPRAKGVGTAVADIIVSGEDSLDELWIPREEVLNSITVDRAEAFIDTMSCPIGSADGFAVNSEINRSNTVVRCPYDVRPTEKYLFVRDGERLLWPFPQRAEKVLAERFRFDLYNSPVSDSFRETQGEYVEEIVYDELSAVFDDQESRVLHSVYYDDPNKENPPKQPEADVIVNWKDFLLVIECKSRSMIAETRGGTQAQDTIEEEIQHPSGIGGGYKQAMRLINGVRNGQVTELRPKSGNPLTVNSSFRFLPAVVMGNHYEYVAMGGFLPFLDLDWRPPYVTDIYSIDAILQLTTPNEMVSYIIRRIQLLKREIPINNFDELDLFAAFRMGILNPDFLESVLAHDFKDEVQDAMEVHPDSDGATLQFNIGDFISSYYPKRFDITTGGRTSEIYVQVDKSGNAQAITLPINHDIRSKAYPPAE
ncbi:nuclease-related domain-containing protein [Haloarcula sp. AONF1]